MTNSSAPLITTAHNRNEESERRLIACLQREKAIFMQVAQEFYRKERSESNSLELSKKIIQIVDRIISAGDWDDSLFLRGAVKPLRKVRDRAIAVRDEMLALSVDVSEIPEVVIPEERIKVYVSLYQADGHDMGRWEAQLCSIASYMVGRPIYQKEQDIQRLMRQKLSQTSEAYLVVSVNKQKIISNEYGRNRTDRFGHEMLAIESGAIQPEDVVEFCHVGRRYHFRNNQLIAKRFAKTILVEHPEGEA